MLSKTPKFDAAINVILKDLKPHTRKCRQCPASFEVFEEDIAFYKNMRVPPQTLCPACRKQRRLYFNYTTFFKRSCTAPGHSENFISLFPPDIPEYLPQNVYDTDYWWSDKWDPVEFGRQYLPGRPFMEQYSSLFRDIPLQQLNRDPKSVGSDYTAYAAELKNCYYIFGGLKTENCMYGNWPVTSRECVDMLLAFGCELCYETIFSKNCYNSDFIYYSDGCSNSALLYDCRECSECFCSTNLRNKKYVFFNKQLTKDKYLKRISEINLGSRKELQKWQKQFWDLVEKTPKRQLHNVKTENSLGDLLQDCKNCFQAFWVESAENVRYAEFSLQMKDGMDISIGGLNSERFYETSGVVWSYDIKFSSRVRHSRNVEYCSECQNCENCFGSIGLRNKKFFILNKQYIEEEYWRSLDEIKTKMLADGEYGDFFPISLSPYAYNTSLAYVEFPAAKEYVGRLGGYWREPEVSFEDLDQNKILKAQDIPDDIRSVDDDILDKIIVSEEGRPFRIIHQELEFYRKKGLPPPTKHPRERIIDRFHKKTPFRLWEYPCGRCGKNMHTSYDPAKKLDVRCEECYLREFA